ncbi:hypothetical protein [Trichothermofontia sp.]
MNQGIPGLPDLTQPQTLLHYGEQFLQWGQGLLVLLAAIGLVLAAIAFAYRGDRPDWLPPLGDRYSQLLQASRHVILIAVLVMTGFLLCSTLANRYHHWEQAKIAQVAGSVAGERVEQPAPLVRYTVLEPYTTITYVNGQPTEVERQQAVDRFLSPSQSQIEVQLTQTTDPASDRLIYQSRFMATYQVTNTLAVTEDLSFEPTPPYGYTLLQDYRVEQDGQPRQPENQGDYRFPVRLAPGESTTFQVSYQAQGAPRWVYTANGRLLSQFRLTIWADFPKADFASGIVPTTIAAEGRGTRFTWDFAENVSVQNPFGVFTATSPVRQTGVLPRLLLLAPGVFLWWLLLLYLTVPLRLGEVAIAAAVFFASVLALTYLSRVGDARFAWGVLLWLLLAFGWGLGRQRQQRLVAIGMTLSGVVLPILALLVPYTGLTLSGAGVLAAGGLLQRYFTRSVES